MTQQPGASTIFRGMEPWIIPPVWGNRTSAKFSLALE
jgi:hypothetical protein